MGDIGATLTSVEVDDGGENECGINVEGVGDHAVGRVNRMAVLEEAERVLKLASNYFEGKEFGADWAAEGFVSDLLKEVAAAKGEAASYGALG
jgi:hypothetical protein